MKNHFQKIIIEASPPICLWLEKEGFSLEDALRASFLLELELHPSIWMESGFYITHIDSFIYQEIYQKCFERNMNPSRYFGYMLFEFFLYLHRQKQLLFSV